jgi:carboxynorspermidine decarboxylase
MKEVRGAGGVQNPAAPDAQSETASGLRDAWDRVATPAFIYDVRTLSRLLDLADWIRQRADCRVLFALKAFAYVDVLDLMATRLDGFAASSVFEARLASEVSNGQGSIHLTTPSISPGDADQIRSLCDFVSFNSLSQWDRYRDGIGAHASCGLRVNPQMSFLEEARYDPCRPHSKLGVPLGDLAAIAAREPDRLSDLQGIHFHSNCESSDFGELLATVRHIGANLDGLLTKVHWVNLGGGYLFERSGTLDLLREVVELLRSRYDLQVFIEPGAAFVQSAGYIVSTVVDLFQNGGEDIAILDTTVNHMPEVFEYESPPDVVGHDDGAPHPYLLAGATCLAGDIFGQYRFQEPLTVGARIIFRNAGAYTLSKAHMFNGVNLPRIYELTEAGSLLLKKEYTYADFAGRWGADV